MVDDPFRCPDEEVESDDFLAIPTLDPPSPLGVPERRFLVKVMRFVFSRSRSETYPEMCADIGGSGPGMYRSSLEPERNAEGGGIAGTLDPGDPFFCL